ncbi:antibiotic biosynthesis monooxygenase [Paenibacillus sp. FSL R10-2782]|uniref:putative quinol monooxygenase n=1 Tax=Paenibacillus sp. FSL R10-2782 TaxID=2954661 RepID=UPI003159060D
MSNNKENVILYIRFKIKSEKKEGFKELLSANMRAMEHEPAFVSAVLSDDIDNSNEVTLFEIWKGTKESWLKEELPKPYRKTFACLALCPSSYAQRQAVDALPVSRCIGPRGHGRVYVYP